MAKYKFTNKAVFDLNSIYAYTINKWSEKQAEYYYKLIISLCQDIAENPQLGKHYEGVSNELYGLRVQQHIIFYRTNNPEYLEITRILHARMDLPNHLKK